uniref:Membrane insertase YidC/Oxa/ALB C-terminal domain-containing protein n=1 Tax=Trichuris muris TaxID=70415 RepID=A0A5S6R4Z3_TRIMR
MLSCWSPAAFTSELGHFYFPPFEELRNALSALHDASGLPWWAVIVGTTLVAKLATFPLAVVSQRNAVRYLMAKPRIEQILAGVRSKIDEEAFRYRWSPSRSKMIYRTNAARILTEIYSTNDFHPFRSLSLTLAQVPIWVSLSVVIRRLCESSKQKIDRISAACEEDGIIPGDVNMMTEGCLWFPDLTVADPCFLLPLILASINYCTLQLHAMPFRGVPMGTLGKCLRYVSLAGIMVLPVASAFVPAGLCFYWVTSSATNFLMYLVLKQPVVKRRFRIPLLPTDPQRPFRDLLLYILLPSRHPLFRRKNSRK